MKSFPIRNTLLGLAASSLINQFNLGRKAAEVTKEMAPTRTMRPRSYKRRRIIRIPRSIPSSKENVIVQQLKRTSAPLQVSLVAGSTASYLDVQLNQVLTADLTSTFQVYRIKKVLVQFIPSQDPDFTGQSFHFYSANDTQGAVTAPAILGTSAYANYRYQTVVGGEKYNYMFYPKVTDTVDVNGTATGVGNFGPNPWLSLTTGGVAVPHHRLIYNIVSTSVTSTAPIQFTVTIWFDVKRIK